MAVHHASLINGVNTIPKHLHIAIITADFNSNITHGLAQKTKEVLEAHLPEAGIDEFNVPGALELTGLTAMILKKEVYDCVILHGCVLRGSTPHFDYVCDSITQGFTTLSQNYSIPIIFGVLTVDTLQQAQERVTSSYGIYALNYLAQRQKAQVTIEKRINMKIR